MLKTGGPTAISTGIVSAPAWNRARWRSALQTLDGTPSSRRTHRSANLSRESFRWTRLHPPRQALPETMLHLAAVVAGVEVYGGSIDRPLRAQTNHDAVLAAGHLLDQRPRLLRQRLPRHDLPDPDHRIDDEIEVGIETCRPIELQVREWPLFVEHADRRLAQALDGLGLGAGRHGGDQNVVAISRVVHHRHRRRALLALKREDAGAVLAHEGAALLGVHHDGLGLLRTQRPLRVAEDLAR